MGWPRRFVVGVFVGCCVVLVVPAVAGAASPPAPVVHDSFSPSTIPVNGTTTLTFTITNPTGNDMLTNVGFSDTLPGDLAVSTPNGITVSCPIPNTAVTFSAPSGGDTVTLAGASIPAGVTCTYTVSITGSGPGSTPNQPGDMTDDQLDDVPFPPGPITVTPVSPPSIGAAFGTSLLGLNGTTSLTFTITNPNPDAGLTGVGFTGPLPSGLVVIGPNGIGNTCGGTVTAGAGTQTIALAGGVLPPGNRCVVSEQVAATSTGTFQMASSPVSSNEGGAGNAGTAVITVVGAPRVTVTSPVGGRKYAFGQKVTASFSCVDDPNGPGIRACVGDAGNGALINTSKAGGRTFTVTAVSSDGGIASDTVFYRVAPNNRFTIGRIRVHRDGSIDFTLTVPGPGRAKATETFSSGRVVFARGQAAPKRAGKLKLTIRPTARGRRAVQAQRDLHVSLVIAYTPHGGTQRTSRVRFTIRS